MAPALHTLTRRECELRLRAGSLGRIAVSTPQGPHIVPVGYIVADAGPEPFLVARIGAYSLLGTYGGGAMLAFEADGVDPAGTSWSVVARGRGEVLHRLPDLGGSPPPWPAELRSLFLRLSLAELSGRRLDAVTLSP